MKKIIAILISVILLTVFSINASAASVQVSCNASTETVKKGDQVTLDFSLSGAESAQAALIEISYSNGFTIVSGQWLKSGAVLTDFNGEDGVIAFAEETNFNGNLFKLVLKAGANVDTAQNVTATVTLKNGTNDAGSGLVTKSIAVESSSSASGSNSSSGGISSVSNNKATGKSVSSNTTKKQTTSKTESNVEKEEQNSETGSTITSSENDSSVDEGSSSSIGNSEKVNDSSNGKTNTKVLWIVIIIVAAVIIATTIIIFKNKKS